MIHDETAGGSPYDSLGRAEIESMIKHYTLMVSMLREEFEHFRTKEVVPCMRKLSEKIVDLEGALGRIIAREQGHE